VIGSILRKTLSSAGGGAGDGSAERADEERLVISVVFLVMVRVFDQSTWRA
jgi:hypothetical protein